MGFVSQLLEIVLANTAVVVANMAGWLRDFIIKSRSEAVKHWAQTEVLRSQKRKKT